MTSPDPVGSEKPLTNDERKALEHVAGQIRMADHDGKMPEGYKLARAFMAGLSFVHQRAGEGAQTGCPECGRERPDWHAADPNDDAPDCPSCLTGQAPIEASAQRAGEDEPFSTPALEDTTGRKFPRVGVPQRAGEGEATERDRYAAEELQEALADLDAAAVPKRSHDGIGKWWSLASRVRILILERDRALSAQRAGEPTTPDWHQQMHNVENARDVVEVESEERLDILREVMENLPNDASGTGIYYGRAMTRARAVLDAARQPDACPEDDRRMEEETAVYE